MQFLAASLDDIVDNDHWFKYNYADLMYEKIKVDDNLKKPFKVMETKIKTFYLENFLAIITKVRSQQESLKNYYLFLILF